VANYALLEWPDNIAILDNPPSEYFPKFFDQYVPKHEQDFARFVHALPADWEVMEYDKFLEERRRLMAKVIRSGFEKLVTGIDGGQAIEETPLTVAELVAAGESEGVEFKGSLFVSQNPDIPERVIVGSVIKTIAAFLNSTGGTLAIGVADDGALVGIEGDLTLKSFNVDQFINALATLIIEKIGAVPVHRCRIRIEHVGDTKVCLVDVLPSSKPVYAETDKGKGLFYVRAANTTRQLDHQETVEYVKERWGLD
jgi:hypothetical protein